MKIYDISVPLGKDTPVYEGDSAIEITPTQSIATGDSLNLTKLCMGAHSGTHIDAPFHFDENGRHIDELDLEVFFGPAQVVEVAAVDGLVTRDAMIGSVHDDTTRLLIKTDNSKLWGRSDFEQDFISLSPEAAKWVVESGIKLIGIDYLSIERFHSPDHAVHNTLLKNAVIIVEGLNLTEVPPGVYNLISLPLRIEGGDGSPTRAILTTLS